MFRSWAFWRRVQYGAGASVFLVLIFTLLYFSFIYSPASCFDGRQNGMERGVDCGGACEKVCAFDVQEPIIQWSKAFRVTNGLYNAVAYIENRNPQVGTSALGYTFTLYDAAGDVITTRSGTTFLPPDAVYPIFEGRIAVGDSIPARTFLELSPVDDWRTMTDGREQFVVESRALQAADTQPRLDATLTNTALDDEFDVEIVTTIFDARGNALTASRTVVPLFEGRATKQVVFTWPEPIATTLTSCEVPTDVMLAIDLSGSMNDDGGTPPQPISAVLDAAESFVERLRDRDQAGVVTFATEESLERQLTNNRSVVADVVSGLRITPEAEVGSTNIGDPIIAATQELDSARHNTNARKVLVLLTDGRANAPGDDAETYAQTAALSAQNAGINVFAIGLGENVNESFLTSIASVPAQRYLAADTRSLDQIYRSISTAICEEGPAVIDIVPKIIGSLGEQ